MATVAATGTRVDAARRRWELVVHLARHELAARYRWTMLGWLWPVARQLAQLGVIVFVFTAVLDLGIEDYALFVFVGLVVWGWFSIGVTGAADALIEYRHLVFQGRFPTEILPLLAITIPFVDTLLTLPVLAGMLLFTGEVHATALLLPLLLAVQALLMAGIGWAVAAATPHLRDVPNIVTVALLMLFYLTPVFFDVARVPEDYQWVLRLNPIALLIEAHRDILMAGQLPDAGAMAQLLAIALVIAYGGWRLFARLRPNFVDAL